MRERSTLGTNCLRICSAPRSIINSPLGQRVAATPSGIARSRAARVHRERGHDTTASEEPGGPWSEAHQTATVRGLRQRELRQTGVATVTDAELWRTFREAGSSRS